MKKPDDNKLDRLFREGLNEPDRNAAFREDDWDAMERLLDEKPHKKNGIFWLYWLSGSVAALLLLFFGWALFKPAVVTKNSNYTVKKTNQKLVETKIESLNHSNNKVDLPLKNDQKSATSTAGKIQIYSDKNSIANQNEKVIISDQIIAKSAPFNTNKNGLKHHSAKTKNESKSTYLAANEVSPTQKQQTDLLENAASSTQIYAGKRSMNTKDLTASEAENGFANPSLNFYAKPVAKNLIAGNNLIAKNKIPAKVSLKMPPRFSLAILSAPDVNGVSSFTGAKIGTNVGLQLSIQLTRKWSINTGAAYASKPYEIDMQQYQSAATYWGKQGEVAADCKVLDIPINVNYQILSKSRNSFAAGAGVSSYFMLRENYNFYYTDNTSYSRNIVNQNKHILGVLNLNATYQRQVNPSFNLIVQPYLKLPLTPIGYEKINLQSAGIAVGVGWNIRSFKNK